MKEQALWLYQQVTRRSRHALLQELRSTAQVPVAILFYHRVADSSPNDWTIGRDDFCRQLDWLQTNLEVVSLEEAQSRIRKPNVKQSVAITFDDGYADNAEFAIPELQRRGIRATYFVSTDFTESQQAFPHDRALATHLRPDSLEELRYYLELGMQLGAHTRSHCDCGTLADPGQIEHEILGSARQLETWLGIQVKYFAFPFGMPQNMTQAAVDCILKNGFKGFCSAYGAWNWPIGDEHSSEAIHLRRIHADPGLQRLKNWLTLDSRKLRQRVALPFDLTSLDSIQL
ncbi:MAG: polysaccharide deacetylase family protein [Planctomycetota bacterium]